MQQLSKAVWYLHVDGEVFGPMGATAIAVILEQQRASFVDFVWTRGFSRWERICDVDLFCALAPAYPVVSTPDPGSVFSGQPGERRVVKAPERWPEPPRPTRQRKPKLRRDFEVLFSEAVEIMGHGTYSSANLREGGIYILTDEPILPGMDVILKFSLPDGPVKIEGRVIRASNGEAEPRGFAVEFTDLSSEVKLRIQNFLIQRKR